MDFAVGRTANDERLIYAAMTAAASHVPSAPSDRLSSGCVVAVDDRGPFVAAGRWSRPPRHGR